MKNIFILMLLILLVGSSGCTKDKSKAEEALIDSKALKYKLDCVAVNRYHQRCENTEVICYQEYKAGMQCKFKK